MERQIHGFNYENKIIEKYGFTKSKSYTDKDDCYMVDGIPIQIKCIRHNGSIDLGDYFRNKSKQKDFILIIGFWKNNKSNIIEECHLYIDHEKWNSLFAFNFDDDLHDLLNEISNDRSDDVLWTKRCKEIKSKWNKVDRVVQLRFKRDHKKQKRIQCAINKKYFYSYFMREFNGQKRTV